ncbi:SURF1 family protein [Rhizobium rhizolycopersici]|uniref:SURF1-like protein n=1 Tax=Mycoplana rhizolycopersici TaxID=2746702 RepID=A0ABX2QB16_9HYPH|nr:SURF1 family protein [Rhizobium rhizolycopersici]
MALDPSRHDGKAGTEGSRRPAARLLFAGAMLLLTVAFVALGAWQVQRLFWKLDLIARVDARVHAQPVPVPPPARWAGFDGKDEEYRRVTAEGTFDHDKEVLVQAVTDLGAGFWVVTPLRQADGTTILINRGFVPAGRRDASSRAEGEVPGIVRVTGLLRLTESGGAFLRANDPTAGRWYSRDVDAIAAAARLSTVAPYFIDADATANPGGLPIGGLTVVRFRNSHLVYALTWFTMAALSVAAAVFLLRQRRRED